MTRSKAQPQTAPLVVVLDAPAAEVTLLEDRAQILRRATVALPAGRVIVRVEDVAPVLSDKSLSAIVRGPDQAARVTDVRVRRALRDEDERESRAGAQLEQQMRDLDAEAEALKGRMKALGKQRTMVDHIARQTLDDLATDVAWGTVTEDDWSAGIRELARRERESGDRELELDARREELEETLADLRRRAGSEERPDVRMAASIETELLVATAGEHTLELTYVVPAACWRPQHTARLLGGTEGEARVVFETDACVWQNTGEDWTDVRLKLSTRRPSLGTEPPLLADDVLEVRRKPEQMVVAAREQEIRTTGLGAAAHPAAELPGIDDGGTTLALEGRRPATLPSDGRPYRVEIARFEATAASEYVLIPEHAPAVIHKVSSAHAGDHPILAGPVDLIAEGGLVGRTSVLFVAPGERFALGFGPDPAIRVHRKSDAVEAKQNVLSRHLRTDYTVTLKLSNIGTEPRDFTVTERIPVSEVEQVKISFDAKASTPDARVDDHGFVAWNVSLPGDGNQTLKLHYSIVKHKAVEGI
ncbi:MAG: DUF4139 domain-containing protein [bacterium]|nr:DUF4139 domain-containing protein [bacterium]